MKKFLFNFIITLLAGLLIQLNTAANELKFVQVTDSHFTQTNPYSEEVLKATINDINSLSGVQFVVFTGDNIDKPNQEELVKFVNIANKLKMPYYMIIGNHDVFKSNGMSKQEYIQTIRDNNFLYRIKTPNYTFKKGDLVFIVVDGAKEVIPGTVGYYKDDTLKWLEKNLKKHSKKQVIILQHFPLIEPRASKSHRTYEGEKYLEMLKKYSNVKAVISGHYHVNHEKMQDGIYHISSPSLLVQPNQYKIIDIITTKGFSTMIYTQLRDVNVK